MKKINLLILVALISSPFLFSSCKKKKDDPAPSGPSCTTLLTQEDKILTSGGVKDTSRIVYIYNTSNKLIQVKYYTKNTTYTYDGYDTITYAGNEIVTVKNYTAGSSILNTTNTYTYTSGKITSVHEVRTAATAYDRTRTFTYTSGVLTSQAVNYTTGSPSAGSIENINSIVFTNGNITSADIGAANGGTATIVYNTSAPNPYRGMNYHIENPLVMFSANISTSVSVPLATLFTSTYTFDNGNVATSTETDHTSGDVSETTYTYDCR